jgi:hypothetical protein
MSTLKKVNAKLMKKLDAALNAAGDAAACVGNNGAAAAAVAKDNAVNPRDYIGKFWVDSLVHDPVQLKLVTDLVA